MRRSTLLLTLGVIFLSFGYTTQGENGISKIYLIDDMLIRTTPGSDISFYNIANPASITKLGSLAIEQNSDVAALGTIMYADRGYDLMVYDITDPSAPRPVDSVKKVFSSFNEGVFFDEGNDVFIGDDSFGGASGCSSGCSEDSPSVASPESGGDRANSGQGGSLARFMIVGNTLYCLDNSEMKIFDITEPTRPRYLNSASIRWGIETIFSEGEELYIGGREGMYIYSIANPIDPEYLGEFTHRRSCDPVVVDGDRAYVTLRAGNGCGTQSDQLDIIDVSNPRNPVLLKTVPMSGPYGLGARDGVVMVCDGNAGLKTLQVGDLNNIVECGGLSDITAYDIIWYGDLLIVTAEEGFWLYDASDPCTPTLYGRLDL